MSNMFPEVYDASVRYNPSRTGTTYNPLTGQMQDVAVAPADKAKADTTDVADVAADTGPSEYEKFLMAQAAEQTRLSRMNATETMKGLLEQYNLSSLYSKVVDYIKQGYDADAIMVLIRTTPEYKQRFPAMDALAAKGRAMSESDYIAYEKTAASLERRYGLPAGMLMNNVTGLLSNDVSATELNDRVMLAHAAAIQAPQDVRNTFSQYYNVDLGGMTAYFLDPQVATPLLEKQYASSVIGTEAYRQGIGIDPFSAENLYDLGISQEQARQGFGQVAQQQSLTSGPGDTATQKELIGANLTGDAAAKQAVDRAVGGRLGKFQGGGEMLQTNKGVTGLQSAAT